MNKKDYFCGWYFKFQGEEGSFAFIPAVHISSGKRSCSLQFIDGKQNHCIIFPEKGCVISEKLPFARLGKNIFSKNGIKLDIENENFSAKGRIRIGKLSPIKYDIMGPFCAVPFMECRHSVFSMRHRTFGRLSINGKSYDLNGGTGYIEGDRGCSFPKRYIWTQCFFKGGSLMLSVADIPLGSLNFTGIIGVIKLCGKEYRLATYLGAKVIKIKNGEIIIKQGGLVFKAQLLSQSALPLNAPVCGEMKRTIKENTSCRAHYQLRKSGRILLDFETNEASFEYEYN